MSEAHDTVETHEDDVPELEAEEREEVAAEEGAESEEGAEKAAAKPVDWEKRAHDKEGLAAKERARRREAERKSRELEQRLERIEAAQKKPEGGQSVEDLIAAMPDPEEDPVGATVAVTRILKLFQQQQSSEAEAETKITQSQAQVRELVTAMNESEAEFAEEHPDYQEAVKHFKAARRGEFEDMGYSGQALDQALAQDLLGLAQRAIQGGRDPAEVVYNLAKKRGFKAKAAAATEKLKEIAEARDAGKGPAGGRNGGGVLAYSDVAKLKGAAFDAAFDKLAAQERGRRAS